jgi:hypothetical protein
MVVVVGVVVVLHPSAARHSHVSSSSSSSSSSSCSCSSPEFADAAGLVPPPPLLCTSIPPRLLLALSHAHALFQRFSPSLVLRVACCVLRVVCVLDVSLVVCGRVLGQIIGCLCWMCRMVCCWSCCVVLCRRSCRVVGRVVLCRGSWVVGVMSCCVRH